MRALVVAVVLVAAGTARAQPHRVDPKEVVAGEHAPEVIVLTFGIGERIFERFGHAAICLNYGEVEATCFNYGVTDFAATGDLVWGFLRDKQKFWVEPQRWYATLAFYEVEDRDIWAQTLPITAEQARAIEHQLLGDLADDAHRFYIYDHFYDNCTTRIRDMIDASTGGKLRAGTDTPYPLTFREMGKRGLAEAPVLYGLVDFVIGRALDKTPTVWEAMFYPAVLREQIRAAFGVEPRLLNARTGRPIVERASLRGRFGMLLVALVFALPLAVLRLRARWRGAVATWSERAAVAWAALYLGLWGLAIWSLVAISAIPGIRWNECALVLVPLDLALPFLGAERRRRYARVRVAGLLFASALCAIGFLHQPLWIPILTAIVPLALIAT
jgi:hypothetical protein